MEILFHLIRISKAIFKAAQAVGGSDLKLRKLAEKVAAVPIAQENYENKTPL